MTETSVYRSADTQSILLCYPEASAPFVCQSSYVYGSHRRIDMCRAVNKASEAIYNACMTRDRSIVHAKEASAQLVDELLGHMGFVRVD